jgi:hypothetical protein
MKLNHNHFIAFFIVLTVFICYYAQQLTGQNLEILANKMISGALVLTVPSGFIYFLRGTKYDVYAEIFDEKNIAAAVLLGFAWLAFGLAVTVVS